MPFLVRITSRAERDLTILYEEIHAAESHAAHRWFTRFSKAILSLKLRPFRCPVTPEDKTLRHLLYGRKPNIYRVIYRINERRKQVDVLHIRHGARHDFHKSDL